MTWPPPPGPPGYPGVPPPQTGIAVPAPAPPKSNGPLIIGLVGGILALCLVGVCGVAAVGVVINNRKDSSRTTVGSTYPPPEAVRTTAPAPPTRPAPPPPPASIGQCIGVDQAGNFLGVGNCNGTSGTYRVVSVDYDQRNCADPDAPYITEDGYRLCLERHLVRFFCYRFPKGDGWIVHAPKCKAKGTVHIIDIVPGASNGDRCTRDHRWNRWYRFTHPTVVYCVMQY
ncbi:hypothetical protein [Plantactinospora sp. KLBMP9567]|uniref:hypothetical protein n=1 Tax=Plantactinospora sp. KLBMP9567 TaxID=3085900 RepID=UPI002981DBFC|nr:hypothetical protein [Plantactinospora sp. KLBMP9567]MDW5328429.1 hypothetical protein [Plantactinospora sp. KLBMP9567]